MDGSCVLLTMDISSLKDSNDKTYCNSNLFCDFCEKLGALKTRQNTNYCDDASNYAVLCEECQKEADKYWYDMWQEYWSSVL